MALECAWMLSTWAMETGWIVLTSTLHRFKDNWEVYKLKNAIWQSIQLLGYPVSQLNFDKPYNLNMEAII